MFNVSTGPAALKDPAVRKAISAGFSRTKVATQAEQGYEAPATSSSSGLLLPNFSSLLPAAYANDLKPDVDAATVTTLMTGAGYAKDGKGIWAKGGKEVSFAIEDPTAYTDYYQSAQIMCADLKTVGFDCKVNGVDANKWYADLAAGTFDTAIHWGTTGPSPYAQYDGWLDPALAKGNNATGNYGRFSNDRRDPGAGRLREGRHRGQRPRRRSTRWPRSCRTRSRWRRSCTPPVGTSTTPRTTGGWVDKDNQYVDPSPNPSNVEFVILHLTPNS